MKKGGKSMKDKIIISISLLITVFIFITAASAATPAVIKNTTSYTHTITDPSAPPASTETNTQTIKVLIYNGNEPTKDGINGIKSALNYANTNNLIPGYDFTYKTSNVINTATLASYDVLAMPGGDDYISDNGITPTNINVTAIKNFVASGKGYVGTCAGAFAGANNTVDCYKGWGVAPNVNCLQPYYEGTIKIQITSAGQDVIGKGGKISTLYWNGPAMTVSGNAIVFARYADGITGSNGKVIISKGMAAIVGDYFGEGRTVLIGPHPELDPQSPDIVDNLIVWAAAFTPNSDTTPPPPPATNHHNTNHHNTNHHNTNHHNTN